MAAIIVSAFKSDHTHFLKWKVLREHYQTLSTMSKMFSGLSKKEVGEKRSEDSPLHQSSQKSAKLSCPVQQSEDLDKGAFSSEGAMGEAKDFEAIHSSGAGLLGNKTFSRLI